MSVCTRPVVERFVPCRSSSGLRWTIRSIPGSAATLWRIAYIAWNFQFVSTWSSGKGKGAGRTPAREVQHDRGILAHRIKHHRPARPRQRFAQDVDALRLEASRCVSVSKCPFPSREVALVALLSADGRAIKPAFACRRLPPRLAAAVSVTAGSEQEQPRPYRDGQRNPALLQPAWHGRDDLGRLKPSSAVP